MPSEQASFERGLRLLARLVERAERAATEPDHGEGATYCASTRSNSSEQASVDGNPPDESSNA